MYSSLRSLMLAWRVCSMNFLKAQPIIEINQLTQRNFPQLKVLHSL
jgi:hypothetical protein